LRQFFADHSFPEEQSSYASHPEVARKLFGEHFPRMEPIAWMIASKTGDIG